MFNKLIFYFRRLWCYWNGWYYSKPTDILLVSFPKAGNTWIRFILYNYFCSTSGRFTEETSFDLVDDIMPEIGHSDMSIEWMFPKVPRIVKTHLSGFIHRKQRVVYILRDPRDVMVSYYKYAGATSRRNYQGSFSSFIRHPRFGLKAYFDHYESWEKHTTYFLRFEHLKYDTFTQIHGLLQKLAIDCDDNYIRQAIEQSNLQNMRKAQKNSRESFEKKFSQKNYQFAREGKAGGWRDFFSDEDLKFYDQLKAKYKFDEYC